MVLCELQTKELLGIAHLAPSVKAYVTHDGPMMCGPEFLPGMGSVASTFLHPKVLSSLRWASGFRFRSDTGLDSSVIIPDFGLDCNNA